MREVCRSAGAFRLLPLLIIALAGCGPSRAEIQEQQDLAKYHYDLAYGYFFDEKNPHGDQALVEVVQSLGYHEKNADTHLLAGLIFQGRERYVDAVQHYLRALELKPDLYYARNNLGAAYLAMERWDDAIAVLTELTTTLLYNEQGHAHNNLGWAWHKKGDFRRAQDHYLKAILLKKELCPAYNNLGLLYLEHDDLDNSEKYLRRGLERCPTYAEPWFHLGRVLLRKGDALGAQQSFKQCIKFGGESPLADRCERQLRPLAAGDAR